MSELVNEYNDLAERIYITWKSRIQASERFKRLDSKASGLSVWYSVLLILISIINFTSLSNIQLNIIILSISIFMFAITTYACSMQYKDKYYQFKSCYIQLQYLYKNVKSVKLDKEPEESLKKLYNEALENYNTILDNTENHSTIDYFKFLKSDKYYYDKKIKVVIAEKDFTSQLQKQALKEFFLFSLLILLPLIVPFAILLLQRWICCFS